ncbi:MAG: type II toxin-antitoxin system YafQ family toxin [Thermodesulfobacteriota bacterium]|nr:type II toxin-antitoxin system YafQ family toxin [Thermodesulfobacteriota bacterium]
MNSRKLIWTKRFSKDVKQAKRRNQNLESLQKVIKMLQSGDILSQGYKLHPLKGKYSGYMECHIQSDWLLIWKADSKNVYLTRTGTHSDLFG